MPINPAKIRVRQLKAAEGYLTLNMPDHALRELNHIQDLGDERFNACMLRGEALLMKEDQRKASIIFGRPTWKSRRI